jgi:hypothetical protein
MAGDEAAKDPNIVGDAMGELCNMVAGNFKAKVTSLADHRMLSVPTVISGDSYVMQAAEPSEALQSLWISMAPRSGSPQSPNPNPLNTNPCIHAFLRSPCVIAGPQSCFARCPAAKPAARPR